jgi:serine/threonine-protein kinase
VLKKIEARVALHLGPVAPRLVSKVIQNVATLGDLCQQLATFIPSGEDQKRFLAWCSAELNGAATPVKARTPAPTAVSQLDAAVLERARRDLSVHLGLFARVIVRRVSLRARNPQELYELLALEIPNEVEREAFRRRAPAAAGGD